MTGFINFYCCDSAKQASHLLTVVARKYGGKKCFTIQTDEISKKPNLAFSCNMFDALNKNNRGRILPSCSDMVSFLNGYLTAERDISRSKSNENKIRDNFRRTRQR